MDRKEDFHVYYELAFGMHPAEELYDLRSDPGQLHNVAADPEYAEILHELSTQLQEYTAGTGDPRALGQDAPWDYYPYYGLRRNKDWYVEAKSAN